jgi:methionine aminopeptidase
VISTRHTPSAASAKSLRTSSERQDDAWTRLSKCANQGRCSGTWGRSCQCSTHPLFPIRRHMITFSFLFFSFFREPIARSNGCAVVRQYTGHGINDLFHTAPNIPHYAKNKCVGSMKAGMVKFSFFFKRETLCSSLV